MASSERDANLSAALYAASRAYAVTAITLRPAASRVYHRARLSALTGGGPFGGGAELATRASDPAPRVRERRPMKRRDISIATGAAVLALQARFDTEMAAINLILDRIDEQISKLEAKP